MKSIPPQTELQEDQIARQILDQSVKHNDSSDWLVTRLERNDSKWVDVNNKVLDQANDPMLLTDENGPFDEPAAKKLEARRHYAQVLHSVKDVSRKLSSGKYAGMRNIVRLVQQLVDIVTEDEALLSITGNIRSIAHA